MDIKPAGTVSGRVDQSGCASDACGSDADANAGESRNAAELGKGGKCDDRMGRLPDRSLGSAAKSRIAADGKRSRVGDAHQQKER